MKLQDAYVSETGQYIGSWKAIGYTMAGSTPAFNYSTGAQSYTNESAALPTSATKVWNATARVGLNDCSVGSEWALYATKGSNGNGLKWDAAIKKGGATSGVNDMDSDCSVLTPQFINLRQGS